MNQRVFDCEFDDFNLKFKLLETSYNGINFKITFRRKRTHENAEKNFVQWTKNGKAYLLSKSTPNITSIVICCYSLRITRCHIIAGYVHFWATLLFQIRIVPIEAEEIESEIN